MPSKILFVEDESALQETISKALAEEGYETISALDGESGIRLAKKEIPNLILLDLILPRKNGFEVLKELKNDPSTRNIPVLVLTNLENTDDVQTATELGAAAYLIKTNYTLEEVAQKVKDCLSHK